MNSGSNEQLVKLPIDLYSRHYIVEKIINNYVRKNKQSLTVLDVGGYKGKTAEFLNNDTVTVLDIFDVDEKDYIKGDATKLTFKDNTYDIVTNFDVFEHIPRAKRLDFIQETYRVAKEVVIMTFPVDNPAARVINSQAEIDLDVFYKGLTKKHHPWLGEHIEYGIPTNQEVKELLDSLKIPHVIINSNDTLTWEMIQAINFLGTVYGSALDHAKQINQIYNQNLEDYETDLQDGYRGIYVLIKNPAHKSIIEKSYKSLLKKVTKQDVASIQTQALRMLMDDISSLYVQTQKQQKQIISLMTDVDNRNKDIKTLQDQIAARKTSLAGKASKVLGKTKKVLSGHHEKNR